MYYLIYQTTNSINQQFYIGMHRTNDMNDEYIGSGIALRQAVKKYGKSNFVKEILHILDSEEEMIAKEIELVTEEFILRTDTYNLVKGGFGAGYPEGRKRGPQSEAHKLKRSLAMQKPQTETHRQNISKAKTGILQTEEHRQNISLAKKGIAQPIVECPKCQKSGGISSMKRWHFSNCEATVAK